MTISPERVFISGVAAGLSLPIVGSAPAQSSATWTSATALSTALTYTGLAPYGAVTIGVTVPTTVTAGAVTIETSLDGTSWVGAGAVRVDNSTAENVVSLAYWPGTNGTRQYLVSLDALVQVRVRLSTVIAGSGNVVVVIAPAQQGVEPFVSVRSRKVPSYGAAYRGGSAGARGLLPAAFTAGARKQYATIHHAATATRTVRLRRVAVSLHAVGTAASQIAVDLIRITSAPATGNPAVTPQLADSSDATVEATCLALPTTTGTEAAAPYTYVQYIVGITGTQSTVSPPPIVPWIEMLNAPATDEEEKLPTIRAGVLEGWAVTIESSAASTISAAVLIEFTEEAP